MIRYIVRKLRGDYTLWTNLNHRIDLLENELNPNFPLAGLDNDFVRVKEL